MLQTCYRAGMLSNVCTTSVSFNVFTHTGSSDSTVIFLRVRDVRGASSKHHRRSADGVMCIPDDSNFARRYLHTCDLNAGTGSEYGSGRYNTVSLRLVSPRGLPSATLSRTNCIVTRRPSCGMHTTHESLKSQLPASEVTFVRFCWDSSCPHAVQASVTDDAVPGVSSH